MYLGQPNQFHACANGATTCRSWIPADRTITEFKGSQDDEVSMGPQPVGHGYMNKGLHHRADPGFNGATTCRSWIPVVIVTGTNRVSMGPQPVGHGYGVCGVRVRRGLPVSMGPQPVGHGYQVLSRLNTVGPNGMTVSMGPQPVGHGYSWVCGVRSMVRQSDWPFQWGHNLSVMDTWNMKYMSRKETFQCHSSVMGNGNPQRLVSMGPQPVGHGYEYARIACES